MKHALVTAVILLFGGLGLLSAQPADRGFVASEGEFVFDSGVSVLCDAGLEPKAHYLAAHIGCRVGNGVAGNGCVALVCNPRGDNDEAFRLSVSPDRVVVDGASERGVFNGIQALLRLLPPEVYARKGIAAGTSVACGELADSPRYEYRGMMLDVTRTWIGAEAVKRYIDLFAYHNLNKLHLHLADDEGWRIEILSHPELAEVGGFRGGDSPVPAVYGKWDERYGGYFTQAEMRELIDYAAVRNIEIIPEIDLPGHSRAIAQLHPEILCDYKADTVSSAGVDYRSAWCVAREENYTLLEDILGEICELFPSKYIHVGGDEVIHSQWSRCPRCRAMMKSRGIAVEELEDVFMERVVSILAAHGKQPGVWNEAAGRGMLTHRSHVYGWERVEKCRSVAAKGYKTIVMPGQFFYFDMRQSPYEDGHNWAAVFDAGDMCGFDLDKAGFTAAEKSNVIGFEGTFFSEAYVSHTPEKPDYLDYMLFPRLCVLSRLAWSGAATPWNAFYAELLAEHYPRLEFMGVHHRLEPPVLTYDGKALVAGVDDGSQLFYRLDNGDPQPFADTIRTHEPHRYRIFSQRGYAQSPHVAHPSHYRTITPSLDVTSSIPIGDVYPVSNINTYRSNARTRRTCHVGDWILYTFAQPVECREMSFRTGERQLPKPIITSGYAEVSYDGATFHHIGDLEAGCITFSPEQAVKAVRVTSTSRGNGTPYVIIQSPQIKPRL